MTKQNYKKELLRDILALGSWVFYILVVIRALIGPFRPFTDRLVIAALILILAQLTIKHNAYAARAVVLAALISLNYQDALFTTFAVLTLILLLFSSYDLTKDKKQLILGVIIGMVSTLAGYYIPEIYYR